MNGAARCPAAPAAGPTSCPSSTLASPPLPMPWSRRSGSTTSRIAIRSRWRSVPTAPWCRSSRRCPPSKLFVENYLYFSAYSDVARRARPPPCEALIETRGPRARVAGGGDRQQRRDPAQAFRRRRGPVLGIDPAPDQAAAANAAGVPTIDAFFGSRVGRPAARGGPCCRRDHRQQRARPRSRAQRRRGRDGHHARRGRADHPVRTLGSSRWLTTASSTPSTTSTSATTRAPRSTG